MQKPLPQRLAPLLLAALLSGPARAAEATPDQVEEWLDSVVLLQNGPAWCSGVMIDDQGTVATAYHCVASGARTRVVSRGGDEGIARTLATRPKEDLALIGVPDLAGVVPPRPLRDTEGEGQLRQGERVYGMGHPFAPATERSKAMEGMLRWSITEGIVSAVGPRLIQTDAALNPGNSGGPVVDDQGRVVGITSRKLGGDNVAFLAPVWKLQEMVAEPEKPSLLGGEWYLGWGLVMPAYTNINAQSVELSGRAVVREHLLANLSLGIPVDARVLAMERGQSAYVSWEANLAARQRFGRGAWSTAFDLGAGVVGVRTQTSSFDTTDQTFFISSDYGVYKPAAFGRVVLGGVGIRVQAVLDPVTFQPTTWVSAIEFDVPGVVATF